eukprot:2071905-Alexandrium_andersonii.AAC.1
MLRAENSAHPGVGSFYPTPCATTDGGRVSRQGTAGCSAEPSAHPGVGALQQRTALQPTGAGFQARSHWK